VEKVALRKFPYPFKAALTICSDIDGTYTLEKFLSIQNFLNTERDTDMGPGLGLEIGNSFFPLTHDDTVSYLSSRPTDRAIIGDFIKMGYIDCMHSYGDGAPSRDDVLRALDALERDGCKVKVWVDHARAPTNFGKDTSPGMGDVIGSPVYHADVTLAYGIKFVWMGRATSLVGQETPITARALTHIYDPAHPRESVEDAARELAKIILARAGSRRFAIHRNNRVFRVARLQDGRQVYEFNRCNNHWHKSWPDSAGLSYVLRRRVLEDLKASEGYMIIYTHLGLGTYSPLIPLPSQSALRNLAEEYRAGEIYVTTTSRLLTYCLTHRYVEWSYRLSSDNWAEITIHQVADPLFGPRRPTVEELQGITFYVPDRYQASIFLGDTQIPHLERNPKDHTRRESVTIARTFLTYPLSATTGRVRRSTMSSW
jgi:hypothetical protein